MNAQAARSAPPKGKHPAPARHAVTALALAFGLSAAPLAWLATHLGAYFLSSHLCAPMNGVRASSMASAASPPFLLLTAVMFILALAGLAVSLVSWRKTRTERGGGEAQLLDVGEGRTRFLSMCGLLVSAAFLGLFLFTVVPMLVAPLCA